MREIKTAKESILNSQNELHTGVFNDYFKTFNLRNKNRKLLKKFINNSLLTEWQAVEVLEGDIFIICAVFKFGIMNRTLFFLYDIKKNELHNFSSTSFLRNKSKVAPSLENKSLTVRETKDTKIEILNELDKDSLYMKGNSNLVEFDLNFKRIAEPIVISVPMTNKHTVYTEKDLLVPSGYIKFKNKEYKLDNKNITILDDHRGYYPLSSGYDWITCMGNIEHNGKKSKFGINLTDFYKNLDPKNISENGYWFDSKFHQLPLVRFKRNNNTWYIKDDQGKVNLVFTKNNEFVEKKKFPLGISYTLAFGTLSGKIKTENNEVIRVNEMFSLGEERITQLLKGKYRQ